MSQFNNAEELNADKKKRLVKQYLQKLVKEQPNLYYESTSVIARQLDLMIKEHKNRMPVEEQALLRNMTVEQIEVILSYR